MDLFGRWLLGGAKEWDKVEQMFLNKRRIMGKTFSYTGLLRVLLLIGLSGAIEIILDLGIEQIRRNGQISKKNSQNL